MLLTGCRCLHHRRKMTGMAKLQDVIKGLEAQLDDLHKFADEDQPLALTQEQAKEILKLLKEQEERIKEFELEKG